MTPQELQSLRNLGNEAEKAADEIERLRAERDTLLTAAVIDTATILRRDEELQRLRAERDAARVKLTAMTVWLEREVPEVFRRGLWDAIDAALKGDAK